MVEVYSPRDVSVAAGVTLDQVRLAAYSERIVLIDGKTLARLMYEYGVGVRTRRTLDVKRVDEAYFEGDV